MKFHLIPGIISLTNTSVQMTCLFQTYWLFAVIFLFSSFISFHFSLRSSSLLLSGGQSPDELCLQGAVVPSSSSTSLECSSLLSPRIHSCSIFHCFSAFNEERIQRSLQTPRPTGLTENDIRVILSIKWVWVVGQQWIHHKYEYIFPDVQYGSLYALLTQVY